MTQIRFGRLTEKGGFQACVLSTSVHVVSDAVSTETQDDLLRELIVVMTPYFTCLCRETCTRVPSVRAHDQIQTSLCTRRWSSGGETPLLTPQVRGFSLLLSLKHLLFRKRVCVPAEVCLSLPETSAKCRRRRADDLSSCSRSHVATNQEDLMTTKQHW